MSFSIKKRAVSFTYAISGIKTLIMTQHNAWVHLFATFTVISAGFLFKLTSIEWALIIFAIIIVWMAKALNTAIEFLADSITKAQHPLIGKAKDVAAAGVLVTAIGATIVGIIIFWPYLTEIVKR